MNNPNSDNLILIVEDEFLLGEEMRFKLSEIGYPNHRLAMDYEEAIDMIHQFRPSLILLDIQLGDNFDGLKMAERLRYEFNIPFIFTSSHTGEKVLQKARTFQPYGYLVKPVDKNNLKTTIEMAAYRSAYEKVSQQEKERKVLLDLSRTLSTVRQRKPLFTIIFEQLRNIFEFDNAFITLWQDDYKQFQYFLVDHQSEDINDPNCQALLDQTLFVKGTPYEELLDYEEPTYRYLEERKARYPDFIGVKIWEDNGYACDLICPIQNSGKRLGNFELLSKKPGHLEKINKEFLLGVVDLVGTAIANVLAYQEIEKLSRQLRQERDYLEEEIKINSNFEEIVGTSEALQSVFNKIAQVAYADTTVMVYGETGTGKELIARAIHNLSPRRDRSLIKLNCATLPPQLLESELFGHERGAFTGANERRVGKFELANNGTIFLDEIGELPIELQAKLLRVIQEKEFERLGGNQVFKTNVRIIAATNRNLEKEISKGQFRADLFFRLNVFPIELPPLRDRKEDIPALATHFLQRSSRKLGKRIIGLSSQSLKALMGYDWPGNIRELEHLIERAVLLNKGTTLNVEIDKRARVEASEQKTTGLFRVQTLKEAERELILKTLKFCGGKVRGKGGAAELLDINPSTLDSRMKKLGIEKMHLFSDGSLT
ncbi:MAG: sigma 54-interacting transcriptional regulator [Bacteroidota bacterium]